jgi:hypothetical protein
VAAVINNQEPDRDANVHEPVEFDVICVEPGHAEKEKCL